MSRLEDCNAVEEDDVVVAYLAGRLSGSEAEAFERHYLGCDRCATALERAVEMRAALHVPGTRAGARFPGSRSAWAMAASVLFVGLALAVLVPLMHEPGPPAATPTVTPHGSWRGGQALAVTALRRPGGGIALSWVARPEASSYLVRVLAADGSAVLERETADAQLEVEGTALAGAPVPLHVRVKALGALGHAVAESDAVEVPER